MKKRKSIYPAFLFIFLIVVGCKHISTLSVTLHPQETRMWCWAASGQMVMDYHGQNVSQCVQANNRFGRSDCCNISLCPNPTYSHPCVSGGWPEFGRYNFSFNVTSNAALSWEQVKNQIRNNKPFAVTWHWLGTGGHMMVANGYFTGATTNYVHILDPGPPCVGDSRYITYDFYVQSPGDHTHWNDYYDITYTP